MPPDRMEEEIRLNSLVNRYRIDWYFRWLVFLSAGVVLLILLLITLFIFREGFEAFLKIGLGKIPL